MYADFLGYISNGIFDQMRCKAANEKIFIVNKCKGAIRFSGLYLFDIKAFILPIAKHISLPVLEVVEDFVSQIVGFEIFQLYIIHEVERIITGDMKKKKKRVSSEQLIQLS